MTVLKISIASTERPTMRLVICPIQDPHREIDVTHRLTAAIAEELWRLFGGNEHLNWIEAELHLQRLVGSARGRVNAGAIEKARAEAPDGARRESDEMLERLFVMVTRKDGDGDADAVPRQRRVMERNGELDGRSPGVRTKPRRGDEAGGRGRKGAARESRYEERVSAA